MAIYKQHLIDIDLDAGTTHRSFWNHRIGEWDEYGDVFGVRIMRNGDYVPLQFVSCTGFFERQDGTTVVVPGEREGNIVYVQLPKSCYAVSGAFKLTLKIVKDNVTASVRIIDGTVVDTAVGGMIDPGSIIPDMEGLNDILDQLLALIIRLESFTITENLISGTRYRIEIDKGTV